MCGISGIIYNNIPKQTDKFKASAKLQAHRGPDYVGYFGDETVDLMHHRLSIIDLDPRAHQPFTDDGQKKIMVYNGEIYNYKDLTKQYDLKTSTTSDTEVLFQLLDNSDFDQKKLNGIYAYAYYDRHKQSLDLSRDRLGVKPLYYYICDDFFIFASEAKVIYDYLDELDINFQALSEFLTFGHSNSDPTLVKGVKKLTPGTTLTLDLSRFQLSSKIFWSVESLVDYQIKPSYAEAKKQAKTLLEQAVKRQCMSDVPVGAYLSGGIDSSAVVALASNYTDKKLQTYSVNFDKSSKSELKAASKVAQQFGTEHYEFEVSANHADTFLTQLIYQYDEPFADPAMIPLHLIAEKASQSSKVVLQGDGGDELFAGYGRHLDLRNYQFRKLTFLALKNVNPNTKTKASFAQRYKRLAYADKGEMMAHQVERDVNLNMDGFLPPSIRSNIKALNPIQAYQNSHQRFCKLPLMQQMLYTDMENILRHKYLEKVDKVNMYHSIEARVPLLDNELVDYVMRLPEKMKIKNNTTKYFFRDLLKGIVPENILNDKKQSFGTPISAWLSSSLYEYALHYFELGKQQGFPFDYDALIYHLKQIKNGNFTVRGTLIWKYLVLTVWLSFYGNKIRNL